MKNHLRAMTIIFGLVACRSGVTPDSATVEYAPFELADHADEAALLAESDVLQREFLEKQPGFVRRELLKIDERHYADLVYWKNKSDAIRAVNEAEKSVVCGKYFSLMKMQSASASDGVVHFERLRTYAP